MGKATSKTKQLGRRVLELKILNEIGQSLSSAATLSIQDIAKLVYMQTSRLMDTTNFYVALYDAQEHSVSFVFAMERGKHRKVGQGDWKTRKAGNGLTEHVVRTGKPLLIRKDVFQWLGKHDVDRIGPLAKSWLGAPLIAGDQVLGVIGIQSYQSENVFDEGDRDILSTIASHAAIAIQNARLFAAQRRRAHSLSKLGEMGRALLVMQKPQKLLGRIAKGALGVLAADVVLLYEYDQSKDDVLVPPISSGRVRFRRVLARKGAVVPHKDSAVFRLIRGRESRYESDWSKVTVPVPSKRGSDKSFVQREGIVSSASVPLIGNGEVVGVMFVNYRTHHRFGKEQKELIELFATQAAIAIRSARQFNQTQANLLRLKMLQQIKSEVDLALDLEDVLERILKKGLAVVRAKAGSLMLLNNETDELAIKATFGPKSEWPERKKKLTFKRGQGIAGRVLATGKPYLSKDTHNDRRFLAPQFDQSIRSLLCVPIVSHGTVVGVINADSAEANFFTSSDMQLLCTLADQAAVNIERAKLLSALQEIGELVSGSSGLNDVLSEISGNAMNVSWADLVTLYQYDQGKHTFITPPIMAGKFLEPQPMQTQVHDDDAPALVIKEGKSHFAPDVENDQVMSGRSAERPRANTKRFVEREKICSAAGLLLKARDEIVGVMFVNYRIPHKFAEDERIVMEIFADSAAIAIQSARLFEKSRRRKEEEQRAFSDIDEKIITTLELDPVFDLILDRALNLIEAQTGTIRLLDEATQELVVKAYRVAPDQTVDNRWERIKVGKGITGRVAETGQSLLVPDATKDERFIPFFSNTLSEVSVPLKQSGIVIGTLSAESPRLDAFQEEHRHILERFAKQAVIAIQNAERYEALGKANEQLEAAREIDRAIVESVKLTPPNLDAVLKLILHKGIELTKSPHGNLMWYDEDTQCLIMRAHEGYSEQQQDRTQKLGEGVVGLAAQERKTILVTDVTSEDWQPVFVRFIPYTRSELAAPMLEGDTKLLGVLNVEHPEPNAYDDNDKIWLEMLARQAVIAVQNVTRFQALQATRKRAVAAERVATLNKLAANFAHRMNNEIGAIPVAADEVTGMISALDFPRRDLALKFMQRIGTDSRRLMQMAKQLSKPFEYSEAESANINLLLEASLAPIQFPTNIKLQTEYGPGHLWAPVPDSQLIDVFKSVVENAIDAMREKGGTLTVSSESSPDQKWIYVRISDTGAGIPEEIRERIFEPFFTTKKRGMGIGLWWCRSFLTQIGGDIEVASTVRKGTTFLVRIPTTGGQDGKR